MISGHCINIFIFFFSSIHLHLYTTKIIFRDFTQTQTDKQHWLKNALLTGKTSYGRTWIVKVGEEGEIEQEERQTEEKNNPINHTCELESISIEVLCL